MLRKMLWQVADFSGVEILPYSTASDGGEGGMVAFGIASLNKPSARVQIPTFLIRLRRMAEREGFEPSVPFPVHILSRDAQSATLSPLRRNILNKLYVIYRST